MRSWIIAALGAVVLSLAAAIPAAADPTAFHVVFPLRFGRHVNESARRPTAAEVRTERRLRLARYGLQIADAIISAIGYRAYAKCLSCLAYPGGGPLGSAPFSVADFSRNRPAEVDPLIQPFSRGGFASLALGTLVYDAVDGQIEKHWSTERREAADIAEIGAHVWGISTWLPEIRNIHHDVAIAQTCGTQWRAKRFGEAFSDGCVNQYYRAGPGNAGPPSAANIVMVCAPASFGRGAYLFATLSAYIVASGTPCGDVHSPFP